MCPAALIKHAGTCNQPTERLQAVAAKVLRKITAHPSCGAWSHLILALMHNGNNTAQTRLVHKSEHFQIPARVLRLPSPWFSHVDGFPVNHTAMTIPHRHKNRTSYLNHCSMIAATNHCWSIPVLKHHDTHSQFNQSPMILCSNFAVCFSYRICYSMSSCYDWFRNETRQGQRTLP